MYIAYFGSSKDFRTKVVNAGCYLINRSPPSHNDRLQDIERVMVIFDCLTYADLKTNNLETRAIKCIFMGYTSRVKEYGLQCTDMHSFRFMINRDVIIYEDIILDVSKQMKQIETCSSSGTIQMESNILSRKKGASNSSQDMEDNVMEQQIDFEDIMGCALTLKSDYDDMVAYTLIVKYGVP